MSLPSIYNYLDYRMFLRDWYDAKKAANPRFSHRAFVRRTGQRSPSLLADLIAGRRSMPPKLVKPIAKAMGLDAAQTRFLGRLVDLDRAQTPEQRNEAWDQIAGSRRFRAARQVEGNSFTYVSTWYYPAIRELARRRDFRPDPTWIASTLRPVISVAQARQALAVLFDLGMLERVDDAVRQAEGAVVTPREVAGLAVHNYHRGMLELAGSAIDSFKHTERHYTGVTVCVPESLVPRLKREIAAFAEQVLEMCDGAEAAPQRVHQIQIQLFPLSARVEEPTHA